jgi:hypothetical protein
MHTLLHYETRTPSYDKAWGATAQALADLAATPAPRRAYRWSFQWPVRRVPLAAKPC